VTALVQNAQKISDSVSVSDIQLQLLFYDGDTAFMVKYA